MLHLTGVIDLTRQDITAEEVDFVFDRVWWGSPTFSRDFRTGVVSLVIDIEAPDWSAAMDLLASTVRAARLPDVARMRLQKKAENSS